MDSDLTRRARLHSALADPHRLAIVDKLRRSDRSPGDLCALLGITTNLLAHHLDILERAGVVDRLVSSGDRRRRYIRLHPEPLAELAHVAPPPTGSALFVCTHNSARSQLAAALWRRRTGAPATSAGTHPAREIHPGAVAAARRAGLDLSNLHPRLIAPGERADVVITVCDRAHEELGASDGWWHWSVPDPVEVGTDAAFDRALADLDSRIRTVDTVG